MIGIEPETARERLGIPAGFDPLTALAIGHAGAPAAFPPKLRDRDRTARERRPADAFVFTGRFAGDLDGARPEDS